MTYYIEGRTLHGESVGSFSFEMISEHEDFFIHVFLLALFAFMFAYGYIQDLRSKISNALKRAEKAENNPDIEGWLLRQDDPAKTAYKIYEEVYRSVLYDKLCGAILGDRLPDSLFHESAVAYTKMGQCVTWIPTHYEWSEIRFEVCYNAVSTDPFSLWIREKRYYLWAGEPWTKLEQKLRPFLPDGVKPSEHKVFQTPAEYQPYRLSKQSREQGVAPNA